MARSIVARTFVVVAILLLALGAGGRGPVAAQGIAIDCPPPASPAATAAASPTAATPEAAPAAFPSGGGDLTVFAAASLTDAFEAIGEDLQAANSDVTIEYNFAGSQALVTQLTEGAEADAFASASAGQMRAAEEAGVIAGEPAVFTQNRLAVVVPADNPGGVTGPADLAQDGLRVVLALPDVPVGQYARESLCKMGRDEATYGEGYVDAVAANVVSEEDNVRAVLAKVQLGEADAGIVYTTDVGAEVAEEVTLVEIPAEVNVVARYPIAPVAGGDAALAAAFVGYVLGPDGQATLAEFGFEPRP